MCGIAGHFGKQRPSDERVSQTLKLMERRGPDGQNSIFLKVKESFGATFLHSRLSIIDLNARANQPFTFGPWTVVYNGELYNYLEIQKTLEKVGRTFKTTSDTEVLIQAIDEWGLQALERFEGMWGLALYDSRDKCVYLSRDRFGEKPLYYCYSDGGDLYFSSEIKSLKTISNKHFPINENHLKRYLVNGYKSLAKSGEEFFYGLQQVPAGSVLKMDSKFQVKTWRYWQPSIADVQEMSMDEAVKGVRDNLIRAVDFRLRSDVPLAFCMSGGVDSNSLISIARRTLNKDVHCFTIVNTDERYDEKEVIEAVVEEMSLNHTPITLQKHGFLEGLRELVKYHDGPVLTITYYVQWLLQKAMASHNYKISISGVAADEIFSGYFDHHLAYLNSIQKNKSLLSKSIENWTKNIKPIVRNPFLSNPYFLIDDPMNRDHIIIGDEEFSNCLVQPWKENFLEFIYSRDLLRNRMANEIFYEITPVILHDEDLNSMYYSIENRAPFLDRGLFEFVQKIPTEYFVQDGMAKFLLRKAMKGIVPDVVLDNPRKVGFNAPILDLLDVNNKETRNAVLEDSPIFEILKRDQVEKILDRKNMSNSVSKFIFYFLSAKMFLEECS